MNKEEGQIPQLEVQTFDDPAIPKAEVKPVIAVKKVEGYRSPFIKDGVVDAGSMNLFLGSLKEQHEAILATAMVYVRLTAMEADRAEGKQIPEVTINAGRVKYEELREKHFPDVDPEELKVSLLNYFQFHQTTDSALRVDQFQDLLDASNFRNTVDRNGNLLDLISAIVTTEKSKGAGTVRDRLRRAQLMATGSPDLFTILLMNSRILLKVKVPTPWEVTSLINNIFLALSGGMYGQRFSVPSIHLERALISRVLVTWILERCTYWSVDDVLEASDLLKVIKKSDIDTIAIGLLTVMAPKGVPYRLTCLADKCKHSETILVNPATMVVFDDVRYPQAYRDQISQLVNAGKRYTVQELLDSELPFVDVDGKQVDDILELPGNQYLQISDPYMDSYFETFDKMSSIINTELRDLAIKFTDENVRLQKRKQLLSNLRMVDYVHYFDKHVIRGDVLAGTKDEVISRSEDAALFSQGIIDIFNGQDEVYAEALVKIIQVAPRLSYTFVGFPDDECPSCKKRAEGFAQVINRGFTPIDPVTTFFAQAQILIASRQALRDIQEEVLS